MKKLATALCLMAFLGTAPGAFAYMQAEEMATVPTLKSLGFSESATKITELVRSRAMEPGSETYYDLDPYSGCTTEKLRWYTAIKRWFDPMQDDELFGRHEISFDNKWVEEAPDFLGDNQPIYPSVNKSAGNANKGSMFKNVGHKTEVQAQEEVAPEATVEPAPEVKEVDVIIQETTNVESL